MSVSLSSIVISILALGLSLITAWLTLFRRGTVRMTQPTLIFFGPDTPVAGVGLKNPLPKVYLRTLLFSTSKRGRVIENMHVALTRNETHQNFSIWVYGEDKLMRGSGLFVGETGITVNHHFLAPVDATGFQFTSGRYRLEVFAHLLGKRSPKRLLVQELEITSEIATQMLTKPGTGVFFNWGPDSSRYYAHTEDRPSLPDLVAALGLKNLLPPR